MSLVSIIIPNHNYARYVGECVESALAQTYTHCEVIVVDNGSTDDSLQVLKQFGNRIKLISQENRGQSGARNRGIQESKGQYLAFCDADDTWAADKLAKQIPLFERPRVGLVYCGHNVVDAQGKVIRQVRGQNRGDVLHLFAESVAAVAPAGESTVVIKRRCFDEVGVFDDQLSISAGLDLYRRIAASYEFDFVDLPLMNYRQHGTNASRRIDVYEQDTLRAVQKMFADPACARIGHLKNQCLGRTHLSISGAYADQRQWAKAITHCALGLAHSPKDILYPLSYPLRVLRRQA